MKAINFLDDVNSYHPTGAFTVRIPPNLTSRDQLFEVISNTLKFPEYFGFNWDALAECLQDFYWIREQLIVIIHSELPRISDESLGIYLNILLDSISCWGPQERHKLEVVFPRSAAEKINLLI